MSLDSASPAGSAGAEIYGPGRVLAPRNLPALAGIGLLVAGIAGAFAYTGGFLSPARLTPARVVDQFERTNGVHPGFRRNHPKGVCFTGWFDSDGAGQNLSKARLFGPGRTPVYGRFAIASGQPYLPDMPGAVHSMALNFTLADGELWRMGMNGIPVFPVRRAEDLYEQLKAAAPDPATGKPDPARLKAFMAAHPETVRAMGLIKAQPLPAGFANTTYNSLNAFLFVDAAGRATPVRWSMVAEDPFVAGQADPAGTKGPNYKFTDLVTRIRSGPIRWRFVATIGQPGDATADPTLPWPASRAHVQLGVLTVDRFEDEAHGACRDVTFDPLILPRGVRGSDDPILSARSAVYARSFVKRSGEPAPNSAVHFPTGAEGAH